MKVRSLIAAGAATLALGAGIVAAPVFVPEAAPTADAHTRKFINSPHSDYGIRVYKEHGCKGQTAIIPRGGTANFNVGSMWQPRHVKIYLEAGPYNGLSSKRVKKPRCYNAWAAKKQVYNFDGPSKGHS